MTDLDKVQQDIAAAMHAAAGGILPDQEEKQFWADMAVDLAAQKVKYALAQTDDEKTRIATNLVYIARAAETRLARKKLKVQNTAEGVMKVAIKAVVNQFFPGAGALGELAKYVVDKAVDGQQVA